MHPDVVQALAALTTGIYVLTVREGERRHGMSSSWATQVSGDPPLLAVAIDRRHFSHDLVERSRRFVLNVVGARALHLEDYFYSRRPGAPTTSTPSPGKTRRTGCRFSATRWPRSSAGSRQGTPREITRSSSRRSSGSAGGATTGRSRRRTSSTSTWARSCGAAECVRPGVLRDAAAERAVGVRDRPLPEAVRWKLAPAGAKTGASGCAARVARRCRNGAPSAPGQGRSWSCRP